MQTPLTVAIEEYKKRTAKIIADSKLPAVIWKDCILMSIMKDLDVIAKEQYKDELIAYQNAVEKKEGEKSSSS